jgi:hypothetical protein
MGRQYNHFLSRLQRENDFSRWGRERNWIVFLTQREEDGDEQHDDGEDDDR